MKENIWPHSWLREDNTMKTALFIASYNRPELMEQLLLGLQENRDALDDLDVFHFIDGGPNSKQDVIIGLINSSTIPVHSIIAREVNYGVGLNIIGARRMLFDELGYERIILIEEDLIPGPNFIKTTISLANWAREFNDVGLVQVWNLPRRPVNESDLDAIEATNEHFYTYCMDVEVWSEIKETIYAYERDYLVGVDYAKKDWRGIRRKFMKPRYSPQRVIRDGNRLFPVDLHIPNPFGRRLKRTVPTSQDAITALALWEKGYVRIATVAPRCNMRGVFGVHSNPKAFERLGLNNQGQYVWQQEVPIVFRLLN